MKNSENEGNNDNVTVMPTKTPGYFTQAQEPV